MDEPEGNWSLLYAFRDPSPSFCHGFALGRLWQRMKTEDGPITESLPTEIDEDVISMATTAGWQETIKHTDNGWSIVILTNERK